MTGQKGFTLIEAMLTSAIAALLAGAVYSLIQLCATHLREGAGRSRLSRISEAASEEIRSLVSRSLILKAYSDPHDLTGFDPLNPPADSNSIVFCEPVAGDTLDGMRLRTGGIVEEWDGIMRDWQPVVFGTDTLRADSARSSFRILPGRRGLRFRLMLLSPEGDSLRGVPEFILARNATRNRMP